jgi:hypothetical protein
VSDRIRAITILTSLRDCYQQRIEEFVLANEFDLRAAVSGQSYTDTEELYELTEKLRQLSLLLSLMGSEQPLDKLHNNTPPPVPTFKDWAYQINAGNTGPAIRILASLFGIAETDASTLTTNLLNRVQVDPLAIAKVNEIGARLKNPEDSGLLALLISECFGVQSPELLNRIIKHVGSHQ